MCGICGFTIPNNDGNELSQAQNTIKTMCDIIAHRGPDGEGFFISDDVALGHRRLSLIDIEGGSQPMSRNIGMNAKTYTSNNDDHLCESAQYVIVFNGEIYNYQDIREELVELGYEFSTDSDTEVLLTSYIAWKEDCLNKLRGMYAFAIWDNENTSFFCARDPFGIKPMYYTFADNGAFVFASEIKSILEHPFVSKRLNMKALEQYMSFQYSVLNETFFSGIFKLPPGCYIEVDMTQDGQCKLREKVVRYWKADYDLDETMSLEDAANKIDAAMQDSVSYHKIADVEVGSFLSSGVDSNYLAASLHNQNSDIKTFTVGFETQDGNKYNEIEYAKEAAEWMGVDNFSHVIGKDEFWDEFSNIQWHMDEPLADPAAAALWFVDKEASKHVKAVLSGEGADEFFGGYPIYQTPVENAKLSFVPNSILSAGSKILSALNIRGANYLYRASTPLEKQFIGDAYNFGDEERYEYLIDSNEFNHESVYDVVAKSYEEVDGLDDVTRMQYIDLTNWLVGDILLKTDKMAMAHSLESRVPFLDKEVWKVARTVPSTLKVSHDESKIALRRAAKKAMPDCFTEKKKLGFPVPIRVWLAQDEYYDKVKSALTGEIGQKFFVENKVKQLMDDHKNGVADNSRKIWTLYSFIVWYERYFGEEVS